MTLHPPTRRAQILQACQRQAKSIAQLTEELAIDKTIVRYTVGNLVNSRELMNTCPGETPGLYRAIADGAPRFDATELLKAWSAR